MVNEYLTARDIILAFYVLASATAIFAFSHHYLTNRKQKNLRQQSSKLEEDSESSLLDLHFHLSDKE